MLVGVLIAGVALGVLQLSLALHVRSTVLDAAAEGARYAALGDATLEDGERRTRELIETALGDRYPIDVFAARTEYHGHPAVEVTVLAPLPLAGLFGPPAALEVTGHAAIEPLAG